MKLVAIFIALFVNFQLCVCHLEWWNYKVLSWANRKRLLQLQTQMIKDLEERIAVIHPIRFMYEESPHYEIGYVLAEIMERYRKMVEMVHRVNSVPDSLFHTMRNLQQQQNFYQEGYNLVCMLHEIPRKYAHLKGFEFLGEAVVTGDDTKIFETYEEQKFRFDSQAKHRQALNRMKRDRIKNMKKNQAIDEIMKQIFGEGNFQNPEDLSPEQLKKAPKRPIRKPPSVTPQGRLFEYGWELNYEWWGN